MVFIAFGDEKKMICRFLLIMLLCLFSINCYKAEKPKKVFIVKVPPFYNDNVSEEENFYRYKKFLFPNTKTPSPIPKGLPNDDSLLFISINKNNKIQLNNESVESASELKNRLIEIFQVRKENKVYVENSKKIVKAVGIKAEESIKYGDFIKVVEAIYESDAEPIVLLFENDARPKLFKSKTNLNK